MQSPAYLLRGTDVSFFAIMDAKSPPSERKRKRTKSITSAQDTTNTPSPPPSEPSPKKKKQTKTPTEPTAGPTLQQRPPKLNEYQTPSPSKPGYIS